MTLHCVPGQQWVGNPVGGAGRGEAGGPLLQQLQHRRNQLYCHKDRGLPNQSNQQQQAEQ